MLSSLQDDLLQEFRAERKMVYEQLGVLDPIATALHRPAAQRLIHSGVMLVFEIFCYLVFLAGIASIFFMHRIYPFHLLEDMLTDTVVRTQMSAVNLSYLNVAVYGLIVLGSILFLVIARMCRTIRHKNSILHMAGKDIKFVVAEYLKRRAAIEAIEQRHLLDMQGVVVTGNTTGTFSGNNSIPLQGFGDDGQ